MLKQRLLETTSQAMFSLNEASWASFERIQRGFHLPAGAYSNSEVGARKRAAMYAPPPVPFVLPYLHDVWAHEALGQGIPARPDWWKLLPGGENHRPPMLSPERPV